jgi:hypothetical protein
VAVLETFSLALFSAANAPLAVIQEPSVEIAFPLAVFLIKPPVKINFHWRFY